ncbi:hypothetical protein [Eastern grey kangaroopox virus]|uniref:Uncharacterized protein n=1 Tax=Eastern grey kangaroopox virus TaxID=2042482 RepID=A0A2C9DSZ8_9POXV|nr:hypothetical protein KM541_gp035 [Eastern grey kangaroopox virus]ATI21131.1 hypothetical protein [Eastern grey kangaroopox virus]ATX75029.1 hypothetical protein EKPV-NSW-ORF048 [Eastern grey kangaroopox virus]
MAFVRNGNMSVRNVLSRYLYRSVFCEHAAGEAGTSDEVSRSAFRSLGNSVIGCRSPQLCGPLPLAVNLEGFQRAALHRMIRLETEDFAVGDMFIRSKFASFIAPGRCGKKAVLIALIFCSPMLNQRMICVDTPVATVMIDRHLLSEGRISVATMIVVECEAGVDRWANAFSELSRNPYGDAPELLRNVNFDEYLERADDEDESSRIEILLCSLNGLARRRADFLRHRVIVDRLVYYNAERYFDTELKEFTWIDRCFTWCVYSSREHLARELDIPRFFSECARNRYTSNSVILRDIERYRTNPLVAVYSSHEYYSSRKCDYVDMDAILAAGRQERLTVSSVPLSHIASVGTLRQCMLRNGDLESRGAEFERKLVEIDTAGEDYAAIYRCAVCRLFIATDLGREKAETDFARMCANRGVGTAAYDVTDALVAVTSCCLQFVHLSCYAVSNKMYCVGCHRSAPCLRYHRFVNDAHSEECGTMVYLIDDVAGEYLSSCALDLRAMPLAVFRTVHDFACAAAAGAVRRMLYLGSERVEDLCVDLRLECITAARPSEADFERFFSARRAVVMHVTHPPSFDSPLMQGCEGMEDIDVMVTDFEALADNVSDDFADVIGANSREWVMVRLYECLNTVRRKRKLKIIDLRMHEVPLVEGDSTCDGTASDDDSADM